jgi:hypothetical protein
LAAIVIFSFLLNLYAIIQASKLRTRLRMLHNQAHLAHHEHTPFAGAGASPGYQPQPGYGYDAPPPYSGQQPAAPGPVTYVGSNAV